MAESCASFLPPDAHFRVGQPLLSLLKSRAERDRPAFLQAARALDPGLATALDGPLAAVTEAMLLAEMEGLMANELPPASAENCLSAEEKAVRLVPAEFANEFEAAMDLNHDQDTAELCASNAEEPIE